MKHIILMMLSVTLLWCSSCNSTTSEKSEYYLLNVYTLDTTSQEPVMDAFLSEAYIPALHRAGVKEVGAFKTIEPESGEKRMIVLFIPLNDPAEVVRKVEAIQVDKAYIRTAESFIHAAYDTPPYSRLETVLLKAFDGYPFYQVPELGTPGPERVYELRSYQSATEELHRLKVDMFDTGESELFVKLGFQPMFFGKVIIGSEMPNLMYMTCHANAAAQEANWKSFVESPEWKEMSGLEKYENTVSHIDRYLLYPAEYSDL